MIKAFVFDLDGTLIDSEVLWVDSLQEVLESKGYAITYDEALAIVYGKAWTAVHAGVNERFAGLYPNIEQMEKDMHEVFIRLSGARDILIHSSIDLLRRLAGDYPVAIVTGAPRSELEEGLVRMAIGECLAFALANEDYAPGKPDPACFRLAAKKLDLAPEHCLVFEDSTAGIEAAKGAGMACVALQRPGRPVQDVSLADETLDDLARFDTERWTNGQASGNDAP